MEDENARQASEITSRLNEIRANIDSIDKQLLELLNQRASLSKEVGIIKVQDKSPVFKPRRESRLLDKLVSENPGPLPENHLRSIWREILSSSRALQRPQNVAYLGPEGTFSYFAGVDYLGHSAKFYPCKDIPQIFEEVTSGSCDLGVVPLENSLQGTVGVSFDLFSRYNVNIQAELYSRISHALLSNAPSLAEIERVYSHPQPLAQCGRWLRTHLPHAALIPVESTAAAAVRAAGDTKSAAIGNAKLAEMRGLELLAVRIEDDQGNWTRFVIIASDTKSNIPVRQNSQIAMPGADKASLLFTLPDKPGSLANVLDILAKHGVNMRKLESRPMSGQPWKYVFFCDVEGDIYQEGNAELLHDLGLACTSFRILGCYSSGPQLDRLDISDEDEEGI